MVDMSPEAVTRRLRLMDELWELSVKLMNGKTETTESNLRVIAEDDYEHEAIKNLEESA